jgi:hypothetical protein
MFTSSFQDNLFRLSLRSILCPLLLLLLLLLAVVELMVDDDRVVAEGSSFL